MLRTTLILLTCACIQASTLTNKRLGSRMDDADDFDTDSQTEDLNQCVGYKPSQENICKLILKISSCCESPLGAELQSAVDDETLTCARDLKKQKRMLRSKLKMEREAMAAVNQSLANLKNREKELQKDADEAKERATALQAKLAELERTAVEAEDRERYLAEKQRLEQELAAEQERVRKLKSLLSKVKNENVNLSYHFKRVSEQASLLEEEIESQREIADSCEEQSSTIERLELELNQTRAELEANQESCNSQAPQNTGTDELKSKLELTERREQEVKQRVTELESQLEISKELERELNEKLNESLEREKNANTELLSSQELATNLDITTKMLRDLEGEFNMTKSKLEHTESQLKEASKQERMMSIQRNVAKQRALEAKQKEEIAKNELQQLRLQLNEMQKQLGDHHDNQNQTTCAPENDQLAKLQKENVENLKKCDEFKKELLLENARIGTELAIVSAKLDYQMELAQADSMEVTAVVPTEVPDAGPTTLATGIYYFNPQFMNWEMARSVCRSKGMDLVAIESPEENEAIITHAKTLGDWVWAWTSACLTWETQEEIWLSTNQAVTYTNWGQGDPDRGKRDCIQLNIENGTWYDYIKIDKVSSICEFVRA